MESSFDPYRKWLGIPPQEQPPHHYRLLGVDPFESDPDVIANAADARMAHLKTFQSGRYSGLSQQLLNQIAAARVCLLKPEKKAEYDRVLRTRLEAAEQAARAALPKAVPVSSPVSPGAEPRPEGPGNAPMPSFSTRPASPYAAGRKRGSWQTPVAILIAAALLAGGLLFLMSRRSTAPTAGRPDASDKQLSQRPAEGRPPQEAPVEREQPGEPLEDFPGQPAEARESSDPELPDGTEGPDETEGTDEAGPPGESGSDNPGEAESGTEEPADPDLPPPRDNHATRPDVPLPDPGSRPEKLAVPDDAEQQSAEREIREVYRAEFAAAGTPPEKLSLADKLFKAGIETTDDPAARFVLFRLACELAGSAGDLQTTFGLIDRITRQYDVDPLRMKADVVAETINSIRTAAPTVADSRQIVLTALGLIDDAVAGDDYQAAARVANLALPAARKAKDLRLIHELQSRDREIDRARQKFAEIQGHLDRLREDAADGEANLEVGRWHCFVKGRWEEGLPLLAKSSDPALTELARRDLARPDDPNEQARLGDDWSSLGENEKGGAGKGAVSRAAHWYRQALPRVSGLTEARIRKKLEEMVAVEVPGGPEIRGVVQPGNVALAPNGTTVAGVGEGAECLFDGNTTRYSSKSGGVAFSPFPCEWIITLGKVYQLQEIRFKFYDRSPRHYQYMMATSADGRKYTPLVDRRQGKWFGWQQIQFPPRPVKTIKVIGLYNSAVPLFNIVEFEAYCVPPATPPG